MGKNDNGRDLIQRVYGNFLVETDEYCTRLQLNNIVEKNLGTKKCPSYNCKMDKVKEKFIDFGRAEVSNRLYEKIQETQSRLRAAIVATLNSEAFLNARIAHHERQIAEDIKKVLIKYQAVAKPHVLKMALDEFICHSICESLVNMTGSDVDSFYDGKEVSPVGRAGVQSEVDYLLSHAY